MTTNHETRPGDAVTWVADDESDEVVTRDDGPRPAMRASERRPPSASATLVRLALEAYRLGCTETGEPFAVPRAASSSGRPRSTHIARLLRGGRRSFRAELSAAYRRVTGSPAPQQALTDALLTLQGEAQELPPERLHLRVAQHGDTAWIDLGDTQDHVVRIADGRWAVGRTGVPTLYQRTELTGALPEPRRGGGLDALWSLVNVTEEDRPIVLAWLVAALLRPDIPHPILAMFGEQGAGKSSASRALIRLVDPSPVELRKPPRDPEGWVTAAQGSYVVGLDNLSTIPDWLSDSLCRAATGEGDVRRALYTDGGLSVFAFRRVILLNGIDVGAMRGDLAERLATVTLARITEGARRTEQELAALWDVAYPTLFGALLDLAAAVAVRVPDVRLNGSPRMADFAHVLAAVDDVSGTTGLTRFTSKSRGLAEDSLDADPFLTALRSQLERTFEGTAVELLTRLSPAEEAWRPPREWPKSSRQVTTLLRRNAPALRHAGWTIDDLGSENKQHATVWQITAPALDGPSGTS